MKQITKEMIREYKIVQLGYDFMGYTFDNKNDLSFHHLVVARKNCPLMNLDQGYFKWNGAILNQNTAHNYLHLIQKYDDEIFLRITSEMIDENIKGKISIENLKKIRDLLLYFEREHQNTKNSKNKSLIKEEYKVKRLKI